MASSHPLQPSKPPLNSMCRFWVYELTTFYLKKYMEHKNSLTKLTYSKASMDAFEFNDEQYWEKPNDHLI